jgi:hypothetical protein
MNPRETARARKEATIEVAICPECFCSIPSDQVGSHARWHETREAHAATAVTS